MRRRSLLLVLASIVASMGAVQRTTNFVVNAPTPQIAAQVGQYAEHYRKEKAILWLGSEMPPWPQPCPLHVTVTMEPPSGATTFTFGHNQVLSMRMEIKGPLDRLLSSVLPHEITHTVFAYHFRCPVPRWADEGGSVLSEDQTERDRHDKLVRNILNQGRQIRTRTLLSLKDYPAQVHCLYAQGFSITEFLVSRSDRPTFLRFLAQGMNYGWDNAVQSFYRHRNVEEMEEAWLAYLRDGRRIPDAQLANNTRGGGPESGMVVRLTAPPVPPLDPLPVARGLMPTQDQVGQHFGQAPAAPAAPAYSPAGQNQAGTWQPVQAGGPPQMPPLPAPYLPAAGPAPALPPVTLGAPIFDAQPIPQAGSLPPGFPR